MARGGAAAGLRRELLLPPANAHRVYGSSVQVGEAMQMILDLHYVRLAL